MGGTLGIVLAGGRGSRLGSAVPKALVRVAGATLLERACARLGPLCDGLVVVAPADLALPGAGAARAFDAPGTAGPLAGLVAGLRSRPFVRAMALAVDLPLLRPGLLRALLERLGEAPAVVPAPGGRLQPLAAAYGPAAVAPLAARLDAGERALVPAVEALGPLVLDDAELDALEGGSASFLNVNRPEDLARAEELLRA